MNNDFQWSDELVREFAYSFLPDCKLSVGLSKLEAFKKSKEKPSLKKEKEPSFKTENGVEVPYGSYIIMLDTQSWSHSYVRIVSDQPINERFKFFSTHEAAEEYTIMNKPCLSLNDIKFWLEKYFNFPNGVSISQLKPLAQSKITNP